MAFAQSLRTNSAKPAFDEDVIDYIAEPGSLVGAGAVRVPLVGHVDHMGRIEPWFVKLRLHANPLEAPVQQMCPECLWTDHTIVTGISKREESCKPNENIVQQQQAHIAASMVPANTNIGMQVLKLCRLLL